MDHQHSDVLNEALTLLALMSERYDWEPESKQRLDGGVAWCRERLADPRLYLGVVGEFSCGKSTLINALLRHDFLRTDLLPETTCAATVIAYAESLDVELVDRHGQSTRHSETVSRVDRLKRFANRVKPMFDMAPEYDVVRQFVAGHAASQSAAAELQQVNVYAPFRPDLQHLVIVDTPGTNVGAAEHAEITTGVTAELCDMVLLVTAADAPLPQSFMRFILDNLHEIQTRCAFAVTRMDTLRSERERERLLQFVRDRITSVLDIEDPIVLPVSSQQALDAWREGQVDSPATREFELQERELIAQLAVNHGRRIRDGLLARTGDLTSGMIRGFRQEVSKEQQTMASAGRSMPTPETFTDQMRTRLWQQLHLPLASADRVAADVEGELAKLTSGIGTIQATGRSDAEQAVQRIKASLLDLIARTERRSWEAATGAAELTFQPWKAEVDRCFAEAFKTAAPTISIKVPRLPSPEHRGTTDLNQHLQQAQRDALGAAKEIHVGGLRGSWVLAFCVIFGWTVFVPIVVGIVYALTWAFTNNARGNAIMTTFTERWGELESPFRDLVTVLQSDHRAAVATHYLAMGDRYLADLLAQSTKARRQAAKQHDRECEAARNHVSQIEQDAAALEQALGALTRL